MRERAYAKINLALDVFNIREDGYHDLKSIMLPIDFYDYLEIKIADKDEFICNKDYLQLNNDNSIVKMINAVKEKYHIDDHYCINLRKHIPSQAGLGGGTSDAAATLRILNRYYKLYLTKEEIKELCLAVGADVLFSYYNQASVVEGIGDKLESFKVKNEYYVVLVKPYTGVSTKKAYETLNMEICDHPNIDILKQALVKGEDIKGLLGNSLEQPSLILNKEIKRIKRLLLEKGASNVLMSGSGSTVFAISDNKQEIENLYNELRNTRYFVRFTKVRKNKW